MLYQSHLPVIAHQVVPPLMYADDVALLATSAQGLQAQLSSVHAYATMWGLSIHIDKTEVMVFTGVCGPAAVCSLHMPAVWPSLSHRVLGCVVGVAWVKDHALWTLCPLFGWPARLLSQPSGPVLFVGVSACFRDLNYILIRLTIFACLGSVVALLLEAVPGICKGQECLVSKLCNKQTLKQGTVVHKCGLNLCHPYHRTAHAETNKATRRSSCFRNLRTSSVAQHKSENFSRSSEKAGHLNNI